MFKNSQREFEVEGSTSSVFLKPEIIEKTEKAKPAKAENAAPVKEAKKAETKPAAKAKKEEVEVSENLVTRAENRA